MQLLVAVDNFVTQLFVKNIPATGVARGSLVLLHGWGFDHRCWQSLVPFLQKNYHLHLIDLPGFGKSSALGLDNAQDWLAQTLALLNQYLAAIDGPVFLVGWSLGGQFALRLSLTGSQIKRVVGVATNLQFCVNAQWHAGMDEATFNQFRQNFSEAPEKTLKEFSRLVAAGDQDFLALRRMLPSVMADYRAALQRDWSFALYALQLLDHTQASFSAPVKLLLSDADALVPIALREVLAQHKSIVIQNYAQAGHGYLLNQPELVARSILDFIDVQ